MPRKAKKRQPQAESATRALIESASNGSQTETKAPSPVDVANDPRPTLRELDAKANEYRRSNDFPALLKLGQLSAFEIKTAPGENVSAWLALQRVRGLAGSEERDAYDRVSSSPDRAALVLALKALRESTTDFHLTAEFELYLRSLGYGPKAALTGIDLLLQACESQPSRMDWLETLRGYVLRLLNNTDEHYEEEDRLTTEERALVQSSDFEFKLRESLENAALSLDLSPDHRMLLIALQADLEMRFAEPWDAERVLHWMEKLEPDGMARAACYDGGRGNPSLTPTAWAFQWELANASQAELIKLLNRHTAGFNDLRCEGLRLIALALLDPNSGDDALLKGLRLLSKDLENSDGLYGHSIAIRTEEGIRYFPASWENFYTKEPWALMVRLVEVLETDHPRAEAVLILAHIWEKAVSYENLDDEELAQSYDQSQSLLWLCDELPQLRLQAASVLPTAAVRLRRHLELVLDWAKSDEQPTSKYIWAEFSDAELKANQRGELIALLERIHPLRMRMTATLSEFFEGLLPHVVDALLAHPNGDQPSKVFDVAESYADELIGADHMHQLAWLAHSTGSKRVAAAWYLRILGGDSTHKAWAAKNFEVLISDMAESSEVETVVAQLNDGNFAEDFEATRAGLLLTAKSKLSTLEQKDQYLRTAINRWPKLTQQARQVLSVLAQIKSYRGFSELGSYAGMDAIWAERHYEKLVESGMVLVGPNGYSINKYIEPLLSRENQHAVVGRIVRANGTTAVKQVFNSQREFTIYQVLVQLCPNHLVFPNCGLQSFMSYERMKDLVADDDFGYYLRASVDILVVSSTTYLPLLAIEVDSIWHDTERQQKNDGKKDRLFATAGVPFLRLRPVGNPSEAVIRGEVAEHLDELVRALREDMPGYDQARALLTDLSKV